MPYDNDKTNRLENENAELKNRLEDQEIIFRQSNILAARYYPATRRIVFPSKTAEVFGVETVMENFPDSYVEKDYVAGNVKQFVDFYESIRRGEPTGRNSTEIRIASGEVRLFNRIFTTIYDAGHNPLYAVISLVDITEQREQFLNAEKWAYISRSLKEGNIHYYDYNMTQDVLERIDGNSPSIYPDRNERSFTGVARYLVDNIIHPDDRDEYLRIFDRKTLLLLFERGQMEIVTEHRRLDNEGHYIHAQGVIQLYSDPFNGDVLAVVVIRDMEKTIAQWKSQLNEEARELLTDSMPGGIVFMYNRSGYPFYSVNRGLLDYLGYENREELERAAQGRAFNLVHPDDRRRVEDSVAEALTQGDFYRVDHRVLRKDGTVMHVIHRGHKSVDHEDREILIGLLADVTELVKLQEEQKAHEKKLQIAVKAAEEAARLKSVFLANMSHEIHTPMNGVVGFAELALDDNTLCEKTRTYLNSIRLSAAELLEILDDILDITNIEAGKMKLDETEFHLPDVFKQCEAACGAKAGEKDIDLYFYSEQELEKILIGDPAKLRQVLLHLLSNAVKFTNCGIVKLSATIISFQHDRIDVRFEVRDTGIGMSEEQTARVFAPFTQGEDGTTRRFGGMGLGLPITRSLIELMGGDELHVESILGVGSKFSFTLPLKTIAPKTEGKTLKPE